jgi:hypothetical protein
MIAYVLGIGSAVILYGFWIIAQNGYQDYLERRQREIRRISQEAIDEHERTYTHEKRH